MPGSPNDGASAEQELLRVLQDDVAFQTQHALHNPGGRHAVVDEIVLEGEYPRTRVVVRAHYSLDPRRTREVVSRIWDINPGREPTLSTAAMPGVIFTELLEWVDTEILPEERLNRRRSSGAS